MTESLILIAVLGTLLIANQYMHWRVMGDLLDRLMARDLPELATFQIERDKARVKEKDQHSDLVRI